MKEEKFGNIIKEIRKKHNLTQNDLAKKYNITYQAVSKWENGKNMPDMLLIKQISEDFNIKLEDLLDGNYKETKKKNILIIALTIIIIITLTFITLKITSNNDFEFKTLKTTCDNFNISGTIAYNKNKSSINISNIEYCGGEDNEKYKSVECTLYEKQGNTNIKIKEDKSTKENITLEEYLNNLTFAVDNYSKICKEYKEDNLYLIIAAQNKENKIITYKVPLTLETCIK